MVMEVNFMCRLVQDKRYSAEKILFWGVLEVFLEEIRI